MAVDFSVLDATVLLLQEVYLVDLFRLFSSRGVVFYKVCPHLDNSVEKIGTFRGSINIL